MLDRRQVVKNLFCTYKTPSCVKLLEIKLVGYVYFWIKWAGLFNPLILSRSDPAETQSLIWQMQVEDIQECVFQRIIRIRWARVFESTHSETGRSRGYTISNLVHIGYWLRIRKRKHKCRQKATSSQVVKKPRIPGDPPLESRFVANNHRNVLFHLVEKYGKWRKRRID